MRKQQGRHQRTLPVSFLRRYEEAMNDPNLIELRSEISLLDVRIHELIEHVKEGENTRFWTELHTVWTKFMHAIRTNDTQKQNELLLILNQIVINGASEREAWQDITSLVEKRRKLVETETRRLVQANQMITVEQAMYLLTLTIGALQEAVFLYADQTTARHILEDAKRRYDQVLSATGNPKAIDGSLVESA